MSAEAGLPASGEPIVIDDDDAGATGAAVGDKRKPTTTYVNNLETVKNWALSEWVWGLHADASTAERRAAKKLIERSQKIHCRGCGAERNAHKTTWEDHVNKSKKCAQTRATPSNWFTGLMLMTFEDVRVKAIGACPPRLFELSRGGRAS